MKRNTDNMEIKRRSTFAILFYINRTKVRKDGTCQLLCKISIDAKWEQIGTKVSYPVLGSPPHLCSAVSISQSVSPMPRDMYVPLSIHPASLSAASFLFSRRSLSNAASAISRLGIFTVVSISFHFQFAVSLSFPLSFAARTPKGRSSILWLKHSVEL